MVGSYPRMSFCRSKAPFVSFRVQGLCLPFAPNFRICDRFSGIAFLLVRGNLSLKRSECLREGFLAQHSSVNA